MLRVMKRALLVISLLLFAQLVSQTPSITANSIEPLPDPSPTSSEIPPLAYQPPAGISNLTEMAPGSAVAVTVSADPAPLGDDSNAYNAVIDTVSVPVSPTEDTAVQVGENLLIYSEANTFGESVDLTFAQVKTLNASTLIIGEPLTTTVSETGNRPFITFQVEAQKSGQNATVDEFIKPVRMAIDLRAYGYDQDEIGGNFYVSYRDESDPSLWHDVPITVHQTDGLISADVTHFSDWSAGWRPEPWAPSWTLPTTSEFSGAATFSYPIEVPPGRAGVQPNIALSYSSRNLDGAIRAASQGNVASGWSIGDSYIIRDGGGLELHQSTWYVHHVANYRLVLNGVGYKLIMDSDYDHSDNGVLYYAKNNPSLKVVRLFSDTVPNDDGLYWVVITPEGTLYRFGYTAEAEAWDKVVHGETVTMIDGHQGRSLTDPQQKTSGYAWYLDTVTDVDGNQILYDYETYIENKYACDHGDWCGHDGNYKKEIVRLKEITYNYSNRPNNSDLYQPGYPGVVSLSVPRGVGTAATKIEFKEAQDRNGISSVYIYHGNTNTDPQKEIRFTLDTNTYRADEADCREPGANTDYGYGTSTRRVTRIQELVGTDADPTTMEAGLTSLPAITLDYTPLAHFHVGDDSNRPCFTYEYLTSFQNGYGGEVRYTYESDNRSRGEYRHADSVMSVEWPKVGFTYSVKTMSQYDRGSKLNQLTYTYENACYNQTLGQVFKCPAAHAPDYGPIAGYEKTTSTLTDRDGTALQRTMIHFLQLPDSLQGKVDERTTAYQVDGQFKIFEKTEYAYNTNTYFGDGTNDNIPFVFLEQEIQREYSYDANGGGQKERNTKTRYAYELGLQADTSFTNGRQWGFLTEIEAYASATATTPYRVTKYNYSANTTGYYWLAKQVGQATYDGSGNLLQATWHYYDSPTSAVGTAPTYGQLVRTRYLATGTACSTLGSWVNGSGSNCVPTTEETFTYDDYGNLLTTTANTHYGHVVSGTWTEGSAPTGGQELVTTLTYDSAYNLYPVSVKNPAGQTTSFEIYGFGASLPTSSFQKQAGLLRKVTDPNGINQFYEYDPFGRLHAVYAHNETAGFEDEYNDNGDPIQRIRYFDNSWQGIPSSGPFLIAVDQRPGTYTGTEEIYQFNFHDGFGRVIQTQKRTDPIEGNSRTDLLELVNTSYDAQGQPNCQSAPYTERIPADWQDRGTLYQDTLCTASPDGFTQTSYGYTSPSDNLDHPLDVRITAPDGLQTRTEFFLTTHITVGSDSILLGQKTTDANDHRVTQLTNHQGQLVKVREYIENPNTGAQESYADMDYAYDLRGNLTETQHRTPGNNPTGSPLVSTSLNYNGFGHKVSMDDADMGQWSYRYDAQGNLVEQADANGNRLCFYYDKLNRLIHKTKTSSSSCPATATTSGSDWLASYTYDGTYTYDSVTYGGHKGALTRVAWAPDADLHQEMFGYDDQGRVITHTRVIDGQPFTMETTSFDKMDRPRTVRYPDGEIVTMTYDRQGGDSLQAGSDNLVTDMLYNGQGQLAKIDRTTASDTTYQYYSYNQDNGSTTFCSAPVTKGNSNHRLKQISHHGSGLSTYSYVYDAVGNIVKLLDTPQGQSTHEQKYVYDELNRLTNVCSGVSAAYTYDLLGNLTSRKDFASDSYFDLNYSSTQPHAVESTSDGGAFAYDANGNMTSRTEDGVTYTQQFDVENRLTAVSTNGQTTQFFYDPSGQRTMSIEPNDSVTYYPFPQYEKEVGQLPTVTNLKANGQTTAYVLVNQPFDMAWNSNYAEGCTATGLDWNGPKDINGNEPITPTSTGTRAYTLTCHNEYGDSTTAQVTVHVGQLPTVSLTADSQGVLVVPVYQTFTLAWSSTNASSCTSNWTSSNATSGTQSLSLHSPQIVTYTRTCHNAYGSTTSAAVSVQTVYAPTVDMSVGPNPVSVGKPFTLEWDSQYTTGSCELSEPSGTLQVVNLSGTLSNLSQATPGTYTYIIQCSNAYGMMTSAEVAVMVMPWPTLNFTVNGQSDAIVAPFQSYTLAWNSANASGCTASGAWNGSKTTSGSGSFIQKLYGLYSYTLTCANLAGDTVSKTVTVTVEEIRCPGGCGGGSLDVFLPSWGVAVASQYKQAEGTMAMMAHNVTEETRLIGPQPKEALTMGKPAQQTSEVVIVRKTYSLAGQLIATRVSGSLHAAENGLFYHYSDHLGSTSTIADASGNVVSNARYYPFGTLRDRTSPASNITELGYTGHHHNDDLGLIYMNARYYVPSISRFASADTLVPDPANPQAYNRYSYVLNNPLRFTDPTGHLSEDEIHDYFGYDSNDALDAWGEELFKLLWDTEITWGEVFDYDGNDAMLVLFETHNAGSSIYRGGFWGLDGAYRGKEVPESELRNSEDVDYNPWRANAYKDWGYSTLPRLTGSDGYNNYDPAVYSDILTIGHAGAAVGTVGLGATIVVGFACASNPVGWVACMGGGAGMVAMGATVGGFGITLISPPDTIDYPLLRLPVVGGNAPQLYGLGSPNGLYE